MADKKPYQFETFLAILQMFDLRLIQNRLFLDYFAEPAIADVFGLHVLFSSRGQIEPYQSVSPQGNKF